jgi:predicted nuclease of predicted toxin-antitoxin system
MLKFKVDENLPVEVAALLLEAGYDALTVPQQRLGGQPDPNIAAVCRQERRSLVTLDLDFSDIRTYPPADYAGIVVLRLGRLDKNRILESVRRCLPLLSQEPLEGKLWIADEMSIRMHD